MKAAVFSVILSLLPAHVWAECVTAKDLSKGIVFKRQDGRTGIVSGQGADIAVNYAATSKTAWTDQRTTKLGIYELSWSYIPTDDYYVGGGPGGSWTYKFSGKPPVPVAGDSWKTRISVASHEDNGSEYGEKTVRSAVDATYRFLEVSTANLSGCTYRIAPVEADFSARGVSRTQRWIYFPDLGFGLETRVTDHQSGEDLKLGLTALTVKK